MKITIPNDMLSDLDELDEAILEFENAFKRERKGDYYYHLIAHNEYNKKVCNEIEKLYTDAGWINVECKTSSDKGERAGLTGLILYKK